jgi:ABC-2 type transport system ATP-binding protein
MEVDAGNAPRLAAPAVIEARNLARWYGPVVGLTDVSMDVPPGISGLLGPNGAGKSTLMRLITGQIFPSRGTLAVLGRVPGRDAAVFRDVGFCSEDDSLFDTWTAREMVGYLAQLSGLSRLEAKERTGHALARCGIADVAERRVGGFSKGMRQRVRLAAATVHEPRLLLLDEPMTGLDPLGRRAVADLIQELASEGCSVLFASHILHEVEALAGHVIVIHKGMVLAEGSIAHIRESLSGQDLVLEVACSDPRALAKHLLDHEHVIAVSLSGGDVVRVQTNSARRLLLEIAPTLLELGLEVESITCPEENLETLFRRLVR